MEYRLDREGDERRDRDENEFNVAETLAHHVGRESVDRTAEGSRRAPDVPVPQDEEGGGGRHRHGQHHEQIGTHQGARE